MRWKKIINHGAAGAHEKFTLKTMREKGWGNPQAREVQKKNHAH